MDGTVGTAGIWLRLAVGEALFPCWVPEGVRGLWVEAAEAGRAAWPLAIRDEGRSAATDVGLACA